MTPLHRATLLLGTLLLLLSTCALVSLNSAERALSLGRKLSVQGQPHSSVRGILSLRLRARGRGLRRRGWGAEEEEVDLSPAGNVTVAVMTSTTSPGDWSGPQANCTWRGRPLGCTFIERPSEEQKAAADALWYHAPASCMRVKDERAGPAQLAAVASMESAANYPCLNNPLYMGMFDLEASYRLSSAVPLPYLRPDHLAAFADDPMIPWGERENAIAYVQSNCAAISRRDQIVQSLMHYTDLKVNSYGRCLNNQQMAAGEGKKAVFQRHRFCLIAENSLERDYVTEKLWDALAAGCVPIFLGAPNAEDFLPDTNAVISYPRMGSVGALREELQRVGGSEALWSAKVAWRKRPLRELRPQYQRLVALVGQQGAECRLCAALREHRHGNTSLVEEHLRRWRWDPSGGRDSQLVYTSNGMVREVPPEEVQRSSNSTAAE